MGCVWSMSSFVQFSVRYIYRYTSIYISGTIKLINLKQRTNPQTTSWLQTKTITTPIEKLTLVTQCGESSRY